MYSKLEVAVTFALVIGFLVTMITLIGYTAAYAVVQSGGNEECLRAGYTHVSTTWNFRNYCIKRVDQTDVVVPIEQAR